MTTTTYRATAISKWRSKPPGAPEGDYRFTEIAPLAGESEHETLARAERYSARLGEHFAVAWGPETEEDEEDNRRVWLASGEELPWQEFLDRFGVQVGLLDKD